MRAKIKTTNITYFLRQEFGFRSINQLFEQTQDHPSLKNKVIHRMVNEFTGYRIENNKLVTYNPYTDKNESLKMKSFGHISSKEDLLKDLSLLHKTRMEMLEQSRKRILELAKESKNHGTMIWPYSRRRLWPQDRKNWPGKRDQLITNSNDNCAIL